MIDRKSLFRRLGQAPRNLVLKSGFMGKDVVESGIFVKIDVLPIRGIELPQIK